jgi:hypothetical protein
MAAAAKPAGPRTCPDCAEVSKNPKVCEHCGHKFRDPRPCPECAEIMTTLRCDACGYDIREKARAAGAELQAKVDNYEAGHMAARAAFGIAGAAIFDAATGGRPDVVQGYFKRKKKR